MLESEQTTYQPTREDVLWLLRAVTAEGPPHDEVARALISGYLWARDRKGVTYTLKDWIRRYSQPVNPRWLPGGDLYRERMQRARARGKADLAERFERQGERRAKASRRTSFPDDVIHAVHAALSKGTRQPVTDFAAWWASPDENRKPLTEPVRGENRFFTRDTSWTGYRAAGPNTARDLVARTLRLTRERDPQSKDDGFSPAGGSGGAVVLFIGFAVWAWWRMHA